ncbi:MAG: septal ring lytic transglycosylase RlpA family protein [Betaproteobacteria bacterium]|nr:septal ring lytic transglycosylase RlpA family protein [Betaproteobacteria bacterium]
MGYLLFRFAAVALLSAGLLAGCGSAPKKTAASSSSATPSAGKYYLDDGPGENAPANLDQIPDAVPKEEPLHRGANRPYTVFGKTYVPNVSTQPFRQEGVASWYGRKFHGQKTSNGEIYDMYAMSAAHPTLPLPSYARVTNPANGKTVIVRVNDRGPFHSERIIDLSFAAAQRLDIARKGSGPVLVERVFASDALTAVPAPVQSLPPAAPPVTVAIPAPPAPLPVTTIPAPPPVTATNISPVIPEPGAFFLQLGAFSSMENAEIFRARMARELDWNREPIQVIHKDGLFRVRLGPYPTRDEAEAIAAAVKASHDFSPVITKP